MFPVIGLLLIGFVPELVAVAQSAEEKAVLFADDMNSAIDCATRGVELSVCSPGLYDHDFSPELNRTVELNQEMIEYIEKIEDIDYISETDLENITITEEEDRIVIVIS